MSAVVFQFPRPPVTPPLTLVPRAPRPVIVAHRADDRAELVAALLLAIEAAPLTPVLCYPTRDVTGAGQVQAVVGGIAFNLEPDDCRIAADALIHERGGEPGVLQTAGTLREAANLADARAPHGGPLRRRRAHRVRTGMASTLGIAAMVLIAVAIDTVARTVG